MTKPFFMNGGAEAVKTRIFPLSFSHDRPPMIIAVVDDLLFGSKIRAAADAASAPLTMLRSSMDVAATLRDAGGSLLIVDLGASAAIDRIRDVRALPGPPIAIVAFASHVRGDLIADARAAGADRVLARSAFVAELPALVRGDAPAAS
jgi:DNA-binding NarL/FixJ family response regulator